jgi:hypothetical protein
MTRKELNAMRMAVADYMSSEGCGCCGDRDAHKEHRAALGKILKVKAHPEDKTFFDFSPFESEVRK